MELGLVLSTHGIGNREGKDFWHQETRVEDMAPVESALLAERLGFHSVWMGDHVSLPEESPDSVTPIGGALRRHYPPRTNILDTAVLMAPSPTRQAGSRSRLAS